MTFMTYKFATCLLWLFVLLLFIGTQMPNMWRVSIVSGLNIPVGLSSWMHFILFLVMAVVAAMHPLAWRWRRVLFAALGLALITEGLQFFTMDRHSRWLDVGIDMSGTLIGVALVRLLEKITQSRL